MVRRQGMVGVKRKPVLVSPAVRVFLFLIAACILIRCLVAVGAETTVESYFSSVFSSSSTVKAIIQDTAGLSDDESDLASTLLAFFMGSSLGSQGQDSLSEGENTSPFNIAGGDYIYDTNAVVTDNGTQSGTAATATSTPDVSALSYSLNAENISLENNTDYNIDIAAMLSEQLNIAIDKTKPQVLIIHTHGSEAYTQDGEDVYAESDSFRTEDTNQSIIRVGDELAEVLESYGITVLHDRGIYDYPSYTGSYNRSLDAVNAYLAEYPDIKIVIDLHRDSIANSDGTQYATTVNINGVEAAPVMIVAGSDSGLEHPNWRENLKLALHLQSAMNSLYPSLAREICLSQNRYNQHTTTGSLIVEVGYAGNTLQEAIAGAQMFGVSLAAVILDHQTG